LLIDELDMGAERKGPTFGKGSLESLTGGVFAIIMTILVFNISVPEFILFEEGEYASERLLNRLELIFVYSFNSILAGLIIYALYHHAKGNLKLVDKAVNALIRKRSGRRIAVTVLTYSIAILSSFIYLPVSHFHFY
jgi:hypothetical protein